MWRLSGCGHWLWRLPKTHEQVGTYPVLGRLPNVPIWLGVDGGEGYYPLDNVFVGNSIALPLDGDDTSSYEWQELSDSLDDLGSSPGMVEEGVVYRDVIVLGAYGAEKDYKDALFKHEYKGEIKLKQLEEELKRVRASEESILASIEKVKASYKP